MATLEERAQEVENICLCLGLGWSKTQVPDHKTIADLRKSLDAHPTADLMSTPGDRQIMADLLGKVIFDVFEKFVEEAHKVRHITENPAAYTIFMLEYCDIVRSFANSVGLACIDVAAIHGANVISSSNDPAAILAAMVDNFRKAGA